MGKDKDQGAEPALKIPLGFDLAVIIVTLVWLALIFFDIALSTM